MPNTLVRDGYSYTTPEIPYIPAQVAYTSVEMVPFDQLNDYSRALAMQQVFIALGADRNSYLYWSVITRTTWPNYVYHPAVAEQPGSPAAVVQVPPYGWNSYARSQTSFFGTGEASWTVPVGVYGAIVGLSTFAGVPTGGYGHIPHGLVFGSGAVSRRTDGTVLGSYVATDVFKMRVYNGIVTYYKNGASISTEASTYTPAPMMLNAVLYAANDSVDAPALAGLYGGSAAMVLPAMTMFGAAGNKAQGIMTLPAMALKGGMAQGGAMVLPAMAMLAADRPYAAAALTLPAMTMSGYTALTPPILRAYGAMQLPAMAMTGISRTGQIGHAAMTLPAMAMLAADRPYCAGQMVLPAMVMASSQEPSDAAGWYEFSGVVTGLDPLLQVDVYLPGGVLVTSTFARVSALDAVWSDTALGTGTMSTSALAEVVIHQLCAAGALLGVLGTGTETWVLNMDNNGTTQYDNYDFNSYALINGRYYAASERGLFLLEGDTDDGEPIRASFSIGRKSGGSSLKKTWEECFVGVSAKGNLFVKVIAEDREYIYKTRSFSDQMKQQRVTFGKGLRTNYVTLEIYNEEGTDFEVDTVEFVIADLTRKI